MHFGERDDSTPTSITCGACHTAFTPTQYQIAFSDDALRYAVCPHCQAIVLQEVLSDAEYAKLRRKLDYGQLAADLRQSVVTISDRSQQKALRLQRVDWLKQTLIDCRLDETISGLTAIYLAAPDAKSLIGYDPGAVSAFVNKFYTQFRLPPDAQLQARLNQTMSAWIQQHRPHLTVTQELRAAILADSKQDVPLALMPIAIFGAEPAAAPDSQRKGVAMNNQSSNQSKLTTADIMATAARMFKNYTSRNAQLINFFTVTDDVLPADPTAEERAAYDFFDSHKDTWLVLPGPDDMALFAADSRRLQVLLASDTHADIHIRTNSNLAYQLFLSQVTRDIQAGSLTGLDQISLLSKPAQKHFKPDSVLRYVSRVPVADQAEAQKLIPGTTSYHNTTLQDCGSGYEDGQLVTTVDFTLTALSISEINYILQHFAPHYEQVHNVTFDDAALLALATDSRGILKDVDDPEKALLLLDQIAAEHASAVHKPLAITKKAVEQTLAENYHAFPVSVLDKATVRDLEAKLNTQVIAQPEATKAVAAAMSRASLGLNNPHRPIATFLFAGPTGVGKTELAKQLALDLYGKEDEYIRLDMSEFSGREDGVYKLIGGAPVWKGSEQGGKLTNALKAHPSAIILFDEFEKSSLGVQNLMLQMLDDGRLTSGLGETFSLTSNILIFTSNAGMVANAATLGFGHESKHYTFSKDQLAESFPKELLNRFSNIIAFQPLSKASLKPILEIKLKRFYQQFAQQGITVTIDDAVKTRLIDLGYDPQMGARPLERAIDNALISPIADFLLNHDHVTSLNVTLAGEEIQVAASAPATPAPITGAALYVDGAFNPQTGTYGYGGLLIIGGKTTELADAANDPAHARLRDYGGEMNGVVAGLKQAQATGVNAITVIYDYQGIENWATGRWQTKQPETKAYQEAVAGIQAQMQLHFQPEKGLLTKEKQRANQLAKIAVGLEK